VAKDLDMAIPKAKMAGKFVEVLQSCPA